MLVLLTATITTTQAQVVINNAIGPAHDYISQAKVALVPPKHFFVSETFDGFEREDNGAVIYVAADTKRDGTGVPAVEVFNKIAGSFTRVNGTETYVINGMNAYLATCVNVTKENTDGICLLVCGNDSVQINAMGVFDINDSALIPAIKSSLLSLVYDPHYKTDAFKWLDYTLDVTGTGFKYAQSIPQAVYFIPESEPDTSENSENFMVGGQRKLPDTTGKDFKTIAVELAIKGPFGEMKIETIKDIQLGGISGYVITGKVTEGKTNTLPLTMHILFGKNLYVLMSRHNTPEYEAGINKAIGTFKLKE